MWKHRWRRLWTFVLGLGCLATYPAVGSAQQQVYPIQCASFLSGTTRCDVGAQVVDATVVFRQSRAQCIIGSTV